MKLPMKLLWLVVSLICVRSKIGGNVYRPDVSRREGQEGLHDTENLRNTGTDDHDGSDSSSSGSKKCDQRGTLVQFDWASGGSFVAEGLLNTTILNAGLVFIENAPSKIAFDFQHQRYVINLFGGSNPLTQWGFANGTYYVINGVCFRVPNYNFNNLLTNYTNAVHVATYYSPLFRECVNLYTGTIQDAGYCSTYGGITMGQTAKTKKLILYGFTQTSGIVDFTSGVPRTTTLSDMPVGSILYNNWTAHSFALNDPTFQLSAKCLTGPVYDYCSNYFPVYRNTTCIATDVPLVPF